MDLKKGGACLVGALIWASWPGGALAAPLRVEIPELTLPAAEAAGRNSTQVLPAAPSGFANEALAHPPALPAAAAPAQSLPGAVASAQERATEKSDASEERGALEAVFDNSFWPRGRLIERLGFNPGKIQGQVLSLHDKINQVVKGKPPKGERAVVVKTADRRAISNEIFIRNVIRGFPIFSEHFDVIESAAYARFLGGAVMVNEFLPVKLASRLSSEQMAALAVLTYAFGIQDLNEEGILSAPGRKTILNDFEWALTPLRENMPAGALNHPALHLSQQDANEIGDYAPLMRRWRALLSRPETQGRLEDLMRRSGMRPGLIRKNLRIINANAALMEKILARDVE